MAKHTVKCPHCGASYKIDEAKLGKDGRCSKCGNNFPLALSAPESVESLGPKVVDEQPSDDPLSSLAAASTAQSTAAPPPRPKRNSFFGKAKEWAAAAAGKVRIVYVQGPWTVKTKSQMTMTLDDSGLVLRVGIINKQEFFISYVAITGLTIDTAERLGKHRTLGAWVLGGPLLGLFVAFGFKKKDKFLVIEWTDETGIDLPLILGAGPGCDMQMLRVQIMECKRAFLRAEEGDIDEPDGPISIQSSPKTNQSSASLLEQIARLRDKGILTPEEFEKKKADILSRM